MTTPLTYPPRETCGRAFLEDDGSYPCEFDPEHVTRGESHRNGSLSWNLSKDEAAKRWRDRQ